MALQISNGFLRADALATVTVVLLLALGATLASRPERFASLDDRVVPLVAIGGLLAHVGLLLTSPAGIYLRAGEEDLAVFRWGMAAVALASGAVASGAPGTGRPLPIGALVASHFLVGLWVIQHSPVPPIDVDLFHRHAVAALRSGHNPYAITFPDIYGNAAYYGPGLSADGRLQFGYPYFPLTLLAVAPGVIFGGDPRYAQLVAMELAAVLMAFSRVRGFGPLAAALYLTTPRTFFVLEQSWTEPFLVFGVAAVTFAACRDRRWVPWLFGGFLALKQYTVIALPAAALLSGWPLQPRTLTAFLLKGATVAAAITLPFFLWNPGAFWSSVVTLQIYQPFRLDALSVPAWLVSLGRPPLSAALSFVAAALVMGLALWRQPRTPAGFALALATTFLAFFLFNKQAFCNYYFFVLGTLCVTLAAYERPQAVE